MTDIRANVDVASPRDGISGWAFDGDDPARPLDVELLVDGAVVAASRADRSRPDVALSFGLSAGDHGFFFAPSALAEIPPDVPASAVGFRIDGSDIAVPNQEAVQSLVADGGGAGRQPQPAPSSLSSALADDPANGPVADSIPNFAELSTRAKLRALNRVMRTTVLPGLQAGEPPQERSFGCIEAVSYLDDDTYAVTGWVSETLPSSSYFGFIPGNKPVAAGLIVEFGERRRDLPAGSVTFAALVYSRWKPQGAAHHPTLNLIVGETVLRIAPCDQTIARSGDQFIDLLQAARANGAHPEAHRVIEAYVRTQDGWRDNSSGQAYLRLAVDRMIVMPRFGMFLEGWALPTQKAIADLSVRLDNMIYTLDPITLYRKPRQDLAATSGSGGSDLALAGFVALLRGQVFPRPPSLATLKATFTDQTYFVQELDVAKVQEVSNLQDISAISTMYGDFHTEPFRPEFKAAIYQLTRDASRIERLAVSPCEKSLIIELPNDKSDCARVMSQLDLLRRPRPMDFGITLIMEDFGPRDIVMNWVQSFNRFWDGGISMFKVRGGHALPAIPHIAAMTKSQRLLFCGRGFLPYPEGIERLVGGACCDDEDGAVFQALLGDTLVPEVGMWLGSAAALARITKRMSGRLDGNYLMQILREYRPTLVRGGVQAFQYTAEYRPNREKLFASHASEAA